MAAVCLTLREETWRITETLLKIYFHARLIQISEGERIKCQFLRWSFPFSCFQNSSQDAILKHAILMVTEKHKPLENHLGKTRKKDPYNKPQTGPQTQWFI